MGLTEVELTIKDPKNPKKEAKTDFLVDSGAAYTVIPARIVKQLGLKPTIDRTFTLADEKKVSRSIGSAIIQYGSEELTVPVVLGKVGDSALLGALTLESFGLALDPFQRKIYPAKLML